MSMIYCEGCAILINSDDDPDCFVEVGNMRRMHKTIALCEKCRHERECQQDIADSMATEAESKCP